MRPLGVVMRDIRRQRLLEVSGGGHEMAEADQLTLNPSVAPAGILAGHPQHEGSGSAVGWVVGLGIGGVGPAAGDELVVPVQ